MIPPPRFPSHYWKSITSSHQMLQVLRKADNYYLTKWVVCLVAAAAAREDALRHLNLSANSPSLKAKVHHLALLWLLRWFINSRACLRKKKKRRRLANLFNFRQTTKCVSVVEAFLIYHHVRQNGNWRVIRHFGFFVSFLIPVWLKLEWSQAQKLSS